MRCIPLRKVCGCPSDEAMSWRVGWRAPILGRTAPHLFTAHYTVNSAVIRRKHYGGANMLTLTRLSKSRISEQTRSYFRFPLE